MAGREKGRKLHFVCREGACGFYEQGTDEEGGVAALTEEMVEAFAGVHI